MFYDSGLESIVFPGTLRAIEDAALAGCKHLKAISFGESPVLETIGSHVFNGSGLKFFIAPSSLKTIGDSAFKNCRNLRHVDLSTCALQTDLLGI